MEKTLSTSWGGVADWYSDLLTGNDTYQAKVILPNLLRLMPVKKGETVLDLGCGTGFFSRALAHEGAKVVGVDIGEALIAAAKRAGEKNIEYHVASTDKIPFIPAAFADQALIVLALQNMENAAGTLAECARVLKPGGRLHLVLNHPAFRVPQASSWGWDSELPGFDGEGSGVQYRRVDKYLSESKVKIQMHPGSDPEKITWSFHRPLQFYFKLLRKNDLVVSRLEEWSSHTKTPAGPRAEAENRARAEFPLFLYLEIIKSARK